MDDFQSIVWNLCNPGALSPWFVGDSFYTRIVTPAPSCPQHQRAHSDHGNRPRLGNHLQKRWQWMHGIGHGHEPIRDGTSNACLKWNGLPG